MPNSFKAAKDKSGPLPACPKFIYKISEENIKYINTDEVFDNLEIKKYLIGHYNEFGYKILAKKFYEKYQIDKQ